MSGRAILAAAAILAGMACGGSQAPRATPTPYVPRPVAVPAPHPTVPAREETPPHPVTPPAPTAPGDPDAPVYDAEGHERGIATWYSTRENGRRTASGEKLSDKGLTAAHKTLPFGTRVKVTNTKNGRQVIVRITDRGPYGHGHIIDLSRAAARAIEMIDAGMVPVTLEVLK